MVTKKEFFINLIDLIILFIAVYILLWISPELLWRSLKSLLLWNFVNYYNCAIFWKIILFCLALLKIFDVTLNRDRIFDSIFRRPENLFRKSLIKL